MDAKQVQELKRAIVFMKMHELREACHLSGIPSTGRKQDLIDRILDRIQGREYTAALKRSKLKQRGEQKYRLNAPMHPETYTNGAMSRTFLKKQIGHHFRFTVFGIDWIQERWAAGEFPTFKEFVEFWQQEYQRRKTAGDFPSKAELARVNLFRKLGKKSNISRVDLEQKWKEERTPNAIKAQEILSHWLNFSCPQK